MIRKIWIINMALAVSVLLIFFAAYRSWHGSSLTATETGESDSRDAVDPPRLEKRNISAGSYDVIEKNNLFSPERKASLRKVNLEAGKEPTIPEDATPPAIKQKYTLFGVVIQGNEARALIQAPVQDKKANPIRWVSVNDMLDEFTVSEIARDKLFLSSGAERYAIPLYKPREAGAPAAPAVVQAAEREAPKIINTQVPEAKNTATEEEKPGEAVVDGNYKIIETPFGKSRIRIK